MEYNDFTGTIPNSIGTCTSVRGSPGDKAAFDCGLDSSTPEGAWYFEYCDANPPASGSCDEITFPGAVRLREW